MNKKSQSEVITPILIILMAFASVFIIGTFIREMYLSQPKFTITERICWNETGEYGECKCPNGIVIVRHGSFTEQKCEAKEVNEIFVLDNCIKMQDLDTALKCLENKHKSLFKEIISKKDLTEEWLNSECKCDLLTAKPNAKPPFALDYCLKWTCGENYEVLRS